MIDPVLRGYRLFVLALGLILCGAQPPKEQTQGKPSAHETEQPASKPYAPYPGYNPDPCYQAKDHDTADLCAQWRAAIAAEKAAKEAGRSTDWSIFATFLSATYENDSKGLELAYIAEVRYSDIFGDRWSLKLLFKRDSSGRWMTVGDSDELNCVYPFGEHQKSRLIQSNRRSLATIRDAFAIMWRKVRNIIGALAT